MTGRLAKAVEIKEWTGCYADSLKGIVVPLAFTHPAKMPILLCKRIFQHGEAQGYWNPKKSAILDMFGGIGTTAVIGCRLGYDVLLIELEQFFVDLINGCDCTGISKEDWKRFYGRYRKAAYMEGRHWCPECLSNASKIQQFLDNPLFGSLDSGMYIKNSGNVPFTSAHRFKGNLDLLEEEKEKLRISGIIDYGKAFCIKGDSRYFNELDIAGVISSPPYLTATEGGGLNKPGNNAKSFRGVLKDGTLRMGDSDGNIGRLPEGVITSPPFLSSLGSDDPDKRGGLFRDPKRRKDKSLTGSYGASIGQVGVMTEGLQNVNQNGETYWDACRMIYNNVFQMLPKKGVMALVIKSFVRNGQIVDLPLMTEKLLEDIGFEPRERIHSMLSETTNTGVDMFTGKERKKTKSKISFFRRLAIQKGSPEIKYETVLFVQKP